MDLLTIQVLTFLFQAADPPIGIQDLGTVLRGADAQKGGTRGIPDDRTGRLVLGQGLLGSRDLPLPEGARFLRGERERRAVLIDRAEPGDAVIQGYAQRIILMDGLHMGVHFPADGVDLVGLDGVFPAGAPPGHFGGPPQLREHGGLLRLVGMQFQAEGAQADGFKATLHHFERRHLLGDEQHPLPPIQGIGDDVGDRLRLAGPGRAVKDEALAAECCDDRLKLGGIRADGQFDVAGGELLVQIHPRPQIQVQRCVHLAGRQT